MVLANPMCVARERTGIHACVHFIEIYACTPAGRK